MDQLLWYVNQFNSDDYTRFKFIHLVRFFDFAYRQLFDPETVLIRDGFLGDVHCYSRISR